MKFAKFAISIIAFFAAYRAVDVLIFGKPINPKKAIAEWTEKVRSELPKPINENTALVAVQSEWYEEGMYGGDDKYWRETYIASVSLSSDSLAQEAEHITAAICNGELQRKVMSLGLPIQVRVSIPKSYHSRDFEVSETLCTARRL